MFTFFSFSLMASTEKVAQILTSREVFSLNEKLAEDGFTFTNVEDNYAKRGVYPRCPCESYSLVFTKHLPSARATLRTSAVPKKLIKTFSVSTLGFGVNKKITISEVR